MAVRTRKSSFPERRRRRSQASDDGAGMSSQLMAMSLFIMLLAFFIVLNAISTFEESKVQSTMDSLQDSFSLKIMRGPPPSSAGGENPENALESGGTVERLQVLFNAQIPDYDKVVMEGDGVMAVRIPRSEFEAALETLQPVGSGEGQTPLSSQPFLPVLVGLVKSEGLPTPYRMEMLLNIPDNPASLQVREPQQMQGHITWVNDTAEKIEGAGLSPRLFSAGVQEGPEDTVDLYFRPYTPFNPLNVTSLQEGEAP